jgi:DNA-binding MarR family transcriptional regulator
MATSTTTESRSKPRGDHASARVVLALHRANLAIQAVKEPPLRNVGMPGSHYVVLINLQATPGLTGAELARLVGLTPQAVALLVSKLTERGVIERRQHPRHRNVQELYLTEAGQRELVKGERIVSDLEQHLRESLGPERHALLRELLGHVIADLPNWRPPAES